MREIPPCLRKTERAHPNVKSRYLNNLQHLKSSLVDLLGPIPALYSTQNAWRQFENCTTNRSTTISPAERHISKISQHSPPFAKVAELEELGGKMGFSRGNSVEL